MVDYKKLFMNYMDAKGVKYEDKDTYVVKVTYTGDNIKSIPIFVFFDSDGDPILQMKCWDIANFTNKEEKGLSACNEANTTYRWAKFYIDKDKDVIAELDAYIDAATCGEECLKLVRRMVSVIDKAYPIFGKALWA